MVQTATSVRWLVKANAVGNQWVRGSIPLRPIYISARQYKNLHILKPNNNFSLKAMIRDPNKKGILGEIAVIKALCSLGYDVFQPVGNHSRVDLIVLSEGVPIKIQVKSTYSKNGIVTIYSRKTCLNPEYNYTYSVNDFDIFAVYIIDKDLVCYISSHEVLANKTMFKLRFEDAKNNQAKGVRYISDYVDVKNALNNCMSAIRINHS